MKQQQQQQVEEEEGDELAVGWTLGGGVLRGWSASTQAVVAVVAGGAGGQ
jgi:hypothetical protein